jgi:hypothetical protein
MQDARFQIRRDVEREVDTIKGRWMSPASEQNRFRTREVCLALESFNRMAVGTPPAPDLAVQYHHAFLGA